MEKCDYFPALGLAGELFRILSDIYVGNFRRLVNKINLKLLTVFAKRSTLNVWLCPESASAGECTAYFKVQTIIYCPDSN